MVEKNYIELWDAYRKGDESSFRQIYDHYYDALLNYGLKFTDNIEIAEDSIQDLFIKLWTNRKKINTTGSVKNYLYKSFRRVIISKLQKANLTVPLSVEDDQIAFDFELSHDHVLMEKEHLKEMQAELQKALLTMTSRQREIIFLRFYEDLSYDQIAELLDITTKGAYKLVYRALDKLRENMTGLTFTMLLLLLKNVRYN